MVPGALGHLASPAPVYTQVRSTLPAAAPAGESEPAAETSPPRAVSPNVYYLGLTSLFTDISSEMISTVLPLYLVFYLRVSGLQLGAVDGLYQGVSAIVRIWGGSVADRKQRHKEVAFGGYALSATSRLLLVLAGPLLLPLVVAVLIDRVGKGIRTAPRDALISLSTAPANLGRAFGVHRAMDTVGAMIGPLLAFGLLIALPGRFDTVFVASLCFAGIGLAVLGLLVRNRRSAASIQSVPAWRQAGRLLRRPRFRLLVAASGGLGIATISDAFVYLTLQRHLSFNPGFLPLLYVATSLVYFVLAIPAGRLADRAGRARVLMAGYACLAAVYVALLVPGLGLLALVLGVLAFGCYYACSDGIMAALVSGSLPVADRTLGLAVQGTVGAVAALGSSLVFGGVWTFAGPRPAVLGFLAVLIVGGVLTAVGLRLTREPRLEVAHA